MSETIDTAGQRIARLMRERDIHANNKTLNNALNTRFERSIKYLEKGGILTEKAQKVRMRRAHSEADQEANRLQAEAILTKCPFWDTMEINGSK